MTDENNTHTKVGTPFASHKAVKQSLSEYIRGEAHINSAESFFSRLKRQRHGTHHAVSRKHLHRYLAEGVFKRKHTGELAPAHSAAFLRVLRVFVRRNTPRRFRHRTYHTKTALIRDW
jgi:hypothetical protein